MSAQAEEWADKLAGWRDDALRIREISESPDRPAPGDRKGRNNKAFIVKRLTARTIDTLALIIKGMPMIDDPVLRRQVSDVVGSVGKNMEANELKRDPVTMNFALGVLKNVAAAMGHHKGLGALQAGEGIERAFEYRGAMLHALAVAREPAKGPGCREGSGASLIRQLAAEHPDLTVSALRRLQDAPDIDERAFRRAVAAERDKR